jgi:chromosome segregation ATPase
MTEPDPAAALAAQLEELRGQLARTQGDVGALRERLEAQTSQTAMARLELKQMRQELDEAIEKRKLKPPPAPWLLGDEAETRALLASLRAWVEKFLRPNYPEYAARLPECWAAHGGALWELATLRAEWERIYADEENRDLAGALNWLHQLLPGVLNRLADAIKCAPGMCQLARRRQP